MNGYKYHVVFDTGQFQLAENGMELDRLLLDIAHRVRQITLVPDDIQFHEAAELRNVMMARQPALGA